MNKNLLSSPLLSSRRAAGSLLLAALVLVSATGCGTARNTLDNPGHTLVDGLRGGDSAAAPGEGDGSWGDGSSGDAEGDIDSSELTADDGYPVYGERFGLNDDVPAVTNLDPALLDALRRAQEAAQSDNGTVITLTAGWRSERYQRYLFEQAVHTYGSVQEASRWVMPGTTSKHLAGKAADVATVDAMEWLKSSGARFGLCQVYSNENWHFELTARKGVCPPLLTDSSGS
jgi:D-alanyl-D-alanine carboxypeptidase